VADSANVVTERKSPPHSPLLPVGDKDSIVRTCETLGEYWLLPDPNTFVAVCDCLDDPCSCRLEKDILEVTEADLRSHSVKDGPFPRQVVDTRRFMLPVLFNPFAEREVNLGDGLDTMRVRWNSVWD
jgi:hypothetical protein